MKQGRQSEPTINPKTPEIAKRNSVQNIRNQNLQDYPPKPMKQQKTSNDDKSNSTDFKSRFSKQYASKPPNHKFKLPVSSNRDSQKVNYHKQLVEKFENMSS